MATFVLGKNGKFYVNDPTGSTYLFTAVGDSPDYSTPTLLNAANAFTEYTNVQDVSLNVDSDEIDVTSRESGGFRETVFTTKNSEITTQVLWRPGDAKFAFLQYAWKNQVPIACMAMDGAWNTDGNSGLIGNFTVSFGRDEPVGGVMQASVTFKGSSFVDWYEHDAG